jgi:phospholipid-binding lipoprotein MlaA
MNGLRVRSTAIAFAALTLTACSTVRTPSKGDPLEGLNRTFFKVNDTLDSAVLKPVAKGYNWVLPQGIRNSISNFFSNIGDVYIAANNLLQGKIAAGTEDIMRVGINTVFGVGGLFDVATLAKLPKHQADFGLTLGHYGVPPGPYLVLPLLGPSTVRDAAGFLVDRELDPTSYVQPIWLRTTLYGVRIVSARAGLLNAGDLLTDAALDKYSFIRNAYLQRRQYLIYDGNPPAPTYDDEGDTGPTEAPAGAAPVGGGAGAGPAALNPPPAASQSGAQSGSPTASQPGSPPASQSTSQPAGTAGATQPAAPAAASAAQPAEAHINSGEASSGAAVGSAASAPQPASAAVPAPAVVPAAPAPLGGPQPTAAGGSDNTSVPALQMMPPTVNFFPSFRLR